jgi:uncharacterized repeat protein (TIGR01451 family)
LTGNNLTYRAMVTNFGPDNSARTFAGVVVRPGLAFVQVTTTRGSCKAPPPGGTGQVVCSLGKVGHLSSNNTATITVVTQVTALQGAVTGAAVVDSAVADPNPANNRARIRTPIQSRDADLSLKMSAPQQLAVGGQATYTLSAHNSGPNAALKTVIVDRIPNGTTFVSATTSQGSCRTPSVGGIGTVRCALGRFGHLATNNNATVTVVVHVVSQSGTLSNVADIFSDAIDPQPRNNRAAATTTIVNGIPIGTTTTADLSVSITGLSATTTPDKSYDLTYLDTVGNAGPDKATGIWLSNPVPDGSIFVKATPSQGRCSHPKAGQTGNVECYLGNIGKGRGATLTLVVHVTGPVGTQIANTATILHDLTEVDLTPQDETQTLSLPITPPNQIVVGDPNFITPPPDPIVAAHLHLTNADLSITDVPSIQLPDVKQLTHNITITNRGPNSVTDATISVQFAGGISVAMAAVTQTPPTPCTEIFTSVTNHFVNCDVGALAVGSSATYTIPTQVSQSELAANPIHLSWSDITGPLSPWQLPPSPPPGTLLTALSVARVTGNVADWNPDNNVAQIMFDPSVPIVVNLVAANPSKCQNKDLGHLAAMFQIDCSSPVNKVVTWGATLAALAAGGIGNATLAAITYYTIYLVALAADVAIVRG